MAAKAPKLLNTDLGASPLNSLNLNGEVLELGARKIPGVRTLCHITFLQSKYCSLPYYSERASAIEGNDSMGTNAAFRRLLVVIKQTAYEEYSQASC